ncbi:MAG: hypothetical protein QOK23_1080 [Gammaproteobacteria bacterium]|jgi:hypothetical protein|nr:hypothetical protein [Gammaproteobacteria bacterium]
MTAPRLMAARLLRRNRHSLLGARGKSIAWLGLCAILVLLFMEREGVATALDWLRSHSLLCDGLAALGSAVMVARRRALKRAEFARSWLAAVPIKAWTARWEALIIEALPALVAMAGLTAMAALAAPGVLVARLPGFSAGAMSLALLSVWGGLMAGIAMGVIASYAMPPPKPVDIPPGSRYVPHKKAQRSAAIRPSLAALGIWPVRQMFAWAQPKVMAPASIPILLSMPMGTTADMAMVAIAMAGIGGALMLLLTAAISVSRSSRRWMAPLPALADSVTRALLFPTLGAIVAASAAETLLLLVFDVALGKAFALGLCTALVGCLVAYGGIQLSGAPRRPMP